MNLEDILYLECRVCELETKHILIGIQAARDVLGYDLNLYNCLVCHNTKAVPDYKVFDTKRIN